MKKITLNETDLLTIVNQVLNEQYYKQLNEDEIGLINFIFERELKPPFRKGEMDEHGVYPYYNRDGEKIGWLDSDKGFAVRDPFWLNIKYKVCQVFGLPYDTLEWFHTIRYYLKSWFEGQLNIQLRKVW